VTLATNPTILVVEDEAFTRMVAIDTIHDMGAQSFEAGDACEALHLLEEHPQVTVLFTDINMPGEMDGLALAEQVHMLRPDIEMVLTSGARIPAANEMPDDSSFLPKPYAAGQLVSLLKEKIAHALHSRRSA
jgi:CheY-like chemotaxis protein